MQGVKKSKLFEAALASKYCTLAPSSLILVIAFKISAFLFGAPSEPVHPGGLDFFCFFFLSRKKRKARSNK